MYAQFSNGQISLRETRAFPTSRLAAQFPPVMAPTKRRISVQAATLSGAEYLQSPAEFERRLSGESLAVVAWVGCHFLLCRAPDAGVPSFEPLFSDNLGTFCDKLL